MKTPTWKLMVLVLGAALLGACDGDTVDSGVFHASWTLTNAAGATDCATVGADKADFLFTGSDNMGYDELFDCADMAGDTAPLPLDDYTYVASLLSCPDTSPGCPGSTTIKMSDAQSVNTDTCDEISGSHCVVDLPTFNFNF